MPIALLLTCPTNELGGNSGVVFHLEHLGNEPRDHATKLAELDDDEVASISVVQEENVDDELGDQQEGAREEGGSLAQVTSVEIGRGCGGGGLSYICGGGRWLERLGV